jgi:hypothetical protein
MSSPDFGGFLVSGQPNAGRELRDPILREVSQGRHDRARIVLNRDLESTAGFDYRDDGCNAWSGFFAAAGFRLVISLIQKCRPYKKSPSIIEFQLCDARYSDT